MKMIKVEYQAVGNNGKGWEIVHLLSEVDVSRVEDRRPGVNGIKLFSSSLSLRSNKLKGLPVESLSSWAKLFIWNWHVFSAKPSTF